MNDLKKLYGRLSLEELQGFIFLFQTLKEGINELDQLVKEKNILKKFDPPYCWADIYSHKLIELVTAYVQASTQSQAIQDIASSSNPQQASLNYADSVDISETVKPDDPKYTVILLNSLLKNFTAITTINHSLCEIVEIIKSKPNSKLFFDAIRIDKTIINNPVFADKIAIAGFGQDEAFFKKLATALQSSGLKKYDPHYDSLRFALYMLEVEEKVLSTLSKNDAYQLFCLDLKLHETDDIDTLWRFIYDWKKKRMS